MEDASGRARPFAVSSFVFCFLLDIQSGVLAGSGPVSAAHNAVGLAGESPAVGIDCLPTGRKPGRGEETGTRVVLLTRKPGCTQFFFRRSVPANGFELKD